MAFSDRIIQAFTAGRELKRQEETQAYEEQRRKLEIDILSHEIKSRKIQQALQEFQALQGQRAQEVPITGPSQMTMPEGSQVQAIPSPIPTGETRLQPLPSVSVPFESGDVRLQPLSMQELAMEHLRQQLQEHAMKPPVFAPAESTPFTPTPQGGYAPATGVNPQKKYTPETVSINGRATAALRDQQGNLIHAFTRQPITEPFVPYEKGPTVDPIISAQIGQIPTQEAGEPAQRFTQRLAEWGKKAMALKEKMNTDPAVARALAYGLGRPVVVMDENGIHYSTAGEAIKSGAAPGTAATAAQAMTRESVLQDVRRSMEQLREAARGINFSGWQRAKVAAALASPSLTATQFVQGTLSQGLTPQEQDYVIQVLNTREQIYGLRRALTGTGGGSDQQSAQILKTIPGANTPNFEFANKQIDTALGVLGRLEKGIPKLGPKQTGSSTAPRTFDYVPGRGLIPK